MSINPYRYLPFLTRKVMRAWAERERPPEHVAWTPLAKPLNQCRVALISSAGVVRRDDTPFDQQAERDNPWRGDPSWRAIAASSTEQDVAISHLHIDPGPAERDLDVVLPMRRLTELAAAGVIGEASARHFSIMGYILDAAELTGSAAPQLADALAEDDVDLVLLVPV